MGLMVAAITAHLADQANTGALWQQLNISFCAKIVNGSRLAVQEGTRPPDSSCSNALHLCLEMT